MPEISRYHAKRHYESIVSSEKLEENGRINTVIAGAKRSLLSIYQELGFVYMEMAHSGQRIYFTNAYMVFSNLITVVQRDTKSWWACKYYCFLILYERGNEGDFNQANIGLENLQRNYEDFDGGKFGFKDKFLKLKELLKDKMPAPK